MDSKKEPKKHPWPVEDVRIGLTITFDNGKMTKEFSTVQELAEYLKEYPEIGEKVGYVVKK